MKSIVQVLSFDIGSKLILGVLGILLIRYMPAAEYAAYTLALALTAFVSQSVAATFNRLYIITGSSEAGREWTLIGAQGLVVSILIILGLPLMRTFGHAYWLIAVFILASCASEFAKTYYQRDLKFLHFSLVELSRSILFFLAALSLIIASDFRPTSNEMLAVQTASLLLVAGFAIYKPASRWPATNLTLVRRHFSKLVRGEHSFLFAYFFVLGVFTQTDIFMLKILGDEVMLASYGSAFRYYSILSLVLGAVHTVLLPTIQKLSNRQELRAVLAMHRRVLVAFVVVTVAVGWLSGWVIPWIDAGKYPAAVSTFRVLCVSAIISFAFSPYVNLLMRFEKFAFLLRLILIALLIHAAISALLIPAFGAPGAAFSVLVSAATVTISIYIKSRKLIASRMNSNDLQT